VNPQLNEQFWWYVARSSGIVAWVLLSASVVWGLLYASRMIPKKTAPKWLLDLHRFLGGLTAMFVAAHLAALVLDSYAQFGAKELLVPFASRWRPGAVAWGVVALYLLVAVEATSLAMKRLPRRVWRSVHATSFVLFGVGTVHTFTAGADAGNPMLVGLLVATLLVFLFTVSYRVLVAFSPVPRAALVTSRPARDESEREKQLSTPA
jgi:sulfoxide reductase heme-binding subunit YedZ